MNPPYPDVRAVVEKWGHALPADAITGATWNLSDAATASRVRQMRSKGIPLGEYVNGKIYYGVKTGFNAAFVIDGATRAALIAQDPNSAEIIKPLATGRDIQRWYVDSKDQWLIFTKSGIDIKRYPAVEKRLVQWKNQLTPKTKAGQKINDNSEGRAPGDYAWYEIQASPGDVARLDGAKIVFPDIAKGMRFAFDTTGLYVNNTTYFIADSNPFLF